VKLGQQYLLRPMSFSSCSSRHAHYHTDSVRSFKLFDYAISVVFCKLTVYSVISSHEISIYVLQLLINISSLSCFLCYIISINKMQSIFAVSVYSCH
jgi:hypothetical protein